MVNQAVGNDGDGGSAGSQVTPMGSIHQFYVVIEGVGDFFLDPFPVHLDPVHPCILVETEGNEGIRPSVDVDGTIQMGVLEYVRCLAIIRCIDLVTIESGQVDRVRRRVIQISVAPSNLPLDGFAVQFGLDGNLGGLDQIGAGWIDEIRTVSAEQEKIE